MRAADQTQDNLIAMNNQFLRENNVLFKELLRELKETNSALSRNNQLLSEMNDKLRRLLINTSTIS
jgi:hypothetical protein